MESRASSLWVSSHHTQFGGLIDYSLLECDRRKHLISLLPSSLVLKKSSWESRNQTQNQKLAYMLHVEKDLGWDLGDLRPLQKYVYLFCGFSLSSQAWGGIAMAPFYLLDKVVPATSPAHFVGAKRREPWSPLPAAGCYQPQSPGSLPRVRAVSPLVLCR